MRSSVARSDGGQQYADPGVLQPQDFQRIPVVAADCRRLRVPESAGSAVCVAGLPNSAAGAVVGA
ncbi:MAG TPA: hypothetical protein DC058_10680 [Planctomycetaceae bacterium]|nr:hypothetical protein [Planctomycetaceae bacterium]HBC61669.1 hypothetical protein [Planctomycetaceae bacterium]